LTPALRVPLSEIRELEQLMQAVVRARIGLGSAA
jgi:hypothetical protein